MMPSEKEREKITTRLKRNIVDTVPEKERKMLKKRIRAFAKLIPKVGGDLEIQPLGQRLLEKTL